MMPWEIHPSALEEFQAAFEYYDGIDPRLADAFRLTYLNHQETARLTPQIYRIREHDIRRVNLGPQFKEWYIAFIIWRDTFIIVAVAHAKRRPFYYLNRLQAARNLV
jgi:hypothetical protein